MVIWVNYSLLFATSNAMMNHMKSTLCSAWEVTDLGEPNKIAGIEITCSDGGITFSQQKYIENLLLRKGMSKVNPVATPLDLNVKLIPNPDENEPNQSNSYAKLLGNIQFIANSTRSDISFAVNKLAAYTANPSLQHHSTLKQILRYLAGTKTLGITYWKSQDDTKNKDLFHGYAPLSWVCRCSIHECR